MNEPDKELLESFIDLLQQIADKEPESRHEHADDLLCELLEELGYKAVVDKYNELEPKWYA